MLKFFPHHPEILAIMSERVDGSMKLFPGTKENLENRRKFFENIGISENQVTSAEIVHGNKVAIIGKPTLEIIPGVDGLITQKTGIFLSITVADCIPVFFYEPEKNIIALAHAGWRGILDGIIINSLEEMRELCGKAENILVSLGPGMESCHFEIQKDVLSRFDKYPESVKERDGKIFVDLKGIIQKQALDFGIRVENIENNPECTFENPERYFSYRRDKPEKVEAMLVVIGLI